MTGSTPTAPHASTPPSVSHKPQRPSATPSEDGDGRHFADLYDNVASSESFAAAFATTGMFGRGAPQGGASRNMGDRAPARDHPIAIEQARENAPAEARRHTFDCVELIAPSNDRSIGAANGRPAALGERLKVPRPPRQPAINAYSGAIDRSGDTRAEKMSVGSQVASEIDPSAPSTARPSLAQSVGLAAMRAQASSIYVALHATDEGMRVFARIGNMAPTERARLREAIALLLAEHGLSAADVILDADGDFTTGQVRRG